MSQLDDMELPLFAGERIRRIHNLVYWSILAGMVLIPELRIFKFDLLHGEHYFLGRSIEGREAKITFLVAFLGVNVLIFSQNYLFGRLVCGWVCPVGYLSRLSRDLKARWMGRRRKYPHLFYPTSVLASVTFGLICLNWVFVDMRTAFRPDDPYFLSAWVAAGVLGTLTFGVVGLVDFGFCRALCPSGAYFTLLSRSWALDLSFEHADQCIECNACIRACPTDLDPRDRSQPIDALKSSWDIYPDDYRHTDSRCFLCGDCIVACDAIFDALNKKKHRQPGLSPIGLLRFRTKGNVAAREKDAGTGETPSGASEPERKKEREAAAV